MLLLRLLRLLPELQLQLLLPALQGCYLLLGGVEPVLSPPIVGPELPRQPLGEPLTAQSVCHPPPQRLHLARAHDGVNDGPTSSTSSTTT